MKTTQTITVDNRTYSVNPYVTTYGFTLLMRLIFLFGETGIRMILGAVGDIKKTGGKIELNAASLLDMDFNDEKLALAFNAFTNKISPTGMTELIKEILIGTIDGNAVVTQDFDTRFQGDYFHMLKLTLATLKVQYHDFLASKGAGAVTTSPASKPQ